MPCAYVWTVGDAWRCLLAVGDGENRVGMPGLLMGASLTRNSSFMVFEDFGELMGP